MRKLYLAVAVALCLWAAPASAQQSLVAQAKEDLRAHGFQVENRACTDFEIVKLVAGRIPGAGLLTKDCCGDGSDPNRSHCEFNGVWYAHDIVAFADGTVVDIAVDGGGANGPSYEVSPPDPSLASRYRSAVSLGLTGLVPGTTPTPVPVPTPQPVPSPTPAPVDSQVVPLLERIITLQQSQLDVIQGIDQTTKETQTHVINIDRTFAQTMGAFSAFVGKYIAPAVTGFLIAKKVN